jgi:hypothetical protein
MNDSEHSDNDKENIEPYSNPLDMLFRKEQQDYDKSQNLDKIKENIEPDINPDILFNLEREDYEKAQAQEQLKKSRTENDILELDKKRRQSDNVQRDLIIYKVWNLITAWLFCVLLLTLFSGIENGIQLPCRQIGAELSCQSFKLHYEKEVLIALISSPTLAVIGLAVIILKYLFPNKSDIQ